jgi:hypothetical protein
MATRDAAAPWRAMAWLREGRRAVALGLVVALLAGSARFLAGLDAVVEDPFHEGEFFAALSAIVFPGAAFTPLTIHGAMDVVPGLLAWAMDPANLLFHTRLATGLMNLAAALLLVLVAATLARGRKGTDGYVLLLAVAGVAGPFLVNFKDLFLLAAALAFLVGQERRGRAADLLVQVAFGVLVALGFFWSAERGLAGTAALGLATLVLVPRAPRYLVALGTFVAAVLAISSVGGVLSLAAYSANLEVLLRTSAQWAYAPTTTTRLLTGFAAVTLAGGAFLVFSAARGAGADRARVANAVLLVLLTAAYYRMSTNRADVGHVDQGMAILLLDLAFWTGWRGPDGAGRAERWTLGVLAVLVSIAGIQTGRLHLDFLALWLVYLAGRAVLGKGTALDALQAAVVGGSGVAAAILVAIAGVKGGFGWVGRAAPPDEALAPAGVRFAARELSAAEVPCVHDMANNGIVNLLVRKPSCSRFSYPVYADRSYEGELVASVRERAPAAVVHSTTWRSYAIDGRPMDARLPALDAELRAGWPEERCRDGYCVRVRAAR